jgi:hypothetical protein
MTKTVTKTLWGDESGDFLSAEADGGSLTLSSPANEGEDRAMDVTLESGGAEAVVRVTQTGRRTALEDFETSDAERFLVLKETD